ncbi:unnamed protein product [Arabidopsis thaliana]|uniref:(thale cress) hypothetical protein n=1 Tax=Arabidopsis thaliana TaxID=3702 RepID=A0A7G2EC13_ARATH|nr:unnamed protein product [Arabidopsis thaliana]
MPMDLELEVSSLFNRSKKEKIRFYGCPPNSQKNMLMKSLFPQNWKAKKIPTLYLPKRFVRANGLDTRCGDDSDERGWRSFCHANGLKARGFSTFKLVQNGRTLVLRLSPKEPKEDCSEANVVESLSTELSDEESSPNEKSSQEYSKGKERKSTLIQKASSSASQNQFVTVTLTR